jgi:hypothetical protein
MAMKIEEVFRIQKVGLLECCWVHLEICYLLMLVEALVLSGVIAIGLIPLQIFTGLCSAVLRLAVRLTASAAWLRFTFLRLRIRISALVFALFLAFNVLRIILKNKIMDENNTEV